MKIQTWSEKQEPTEEVIRNMMKAEGLRPYIWSNDPGDVYASHSHSYHKVIYVIYGSIAFEIPNEGQQATLHVGDRLDLPPGMIHSAVVGPKGVVCVEAHRR